MSGERIIREYLRKNASKGGKAGTKAQTEARKRNVAKARKTRWKDSNHPGQ